MRSTRAWSTGRALFIILALKGHHGDRVMATTAHHGFVGQVYCIGISETWVEDWDGRWTADGGRIRNDCMITTAYQIGMAECGTA